MPIGAGFGKIWPWRRREAVATSPTHLALEGASAVRGDVVRKRIGLAMVGVAAVYLVIGGRLVQYGLTDPGSSRGRLVADLTTQARRPDLQDRRGVVLATDISTVSLAADPRRIVDADEAVELLSTVLPDLDPQLTHRRLTSKTGFVWLKREMTPAQQDQILALGIPGLEFRRETRRFYPQGRLASHVIGHVNIDNIGIAGMEKAIDARGLADLRAAGFTTQEDLAPVRLSLDLRVQQIVRDELSKGMARYKAIAAGGIVLDVTTGEIVAMASLPDYDPNQPADALLPNNLNRVSAGLFEMGSTFKAFTTAMALDSGKVNLGDSFDASRPLRIGGFTINDFHGKRRVLTVPEVFIYSSNIATAKMADTVGIEGHREFLHRIGLLDRLKFELPETASPVEPREWKKINSVTISFGHGVTTTPLNTAVATAALVNGGLLIPPTLEPRDEAAASAVAHQVVGAKTSDAMRYLMRLNVEKGSGKRAEVIGYRVGGKTGTAEKVVNGRYSSSARFNAFLSAFPIDKPRYIVLVFIDEPKPEDGKSGATAGSNAAPMVGAIVRRAAGMLEVAPRFEDLDRPWEISLDTGR